MKLPVPPQGHRSIIDAAGERSGGPAAYRQGVRQTPRSIVQTREPTWYLKRLCPVCEQGACLVLIACPTCARLAVRCEEEGTLFLDPQLPTADAPVAPDDLACPCCGKTILRDYVPATDQQILKAGFTAADYE
jgi:hypothetical protein